MIDDHWIIGFYVHQIWIIGWSGVLMIGFYFDFLRIKTVGDFNDLGSRVYGVGCVHILWNLWWQCAKPWDFRENVDVQPSQRTNGLYSEQLLPGIFKRIGDCSKGNSPEMMGLWHGGLHPVFRYGFPGFHTFPVDSCGKNGPDSHPQSPFLYPQDTKGAIMPDTKITNQLKPSTNKYMGLCVYIYIKS